MHRPRHHGTQPCPQCSSPVSNVQGIDACPTCTWIEPVAQWRG